MAPAIEPKGSVRALGKAMELLGLLLDHRGPMTLQELQKRSGYPKSTVHGLLSTLREYDMIGQNPDGTYCLGIRLYEYGCAVAGAWDITALAHPYLEKLAAQTGGGAFLSLRSERHAISFDKAVSAAGFGLQVSVETGTPLPLHATAQGKLLLSGCSESEIRRVLDGGLVAYTRHTVTDPDRLLAQLAEARARGYALEDGEYKVGLRSVAAPVYDQTGRLCYAFGVVGLFGRVTSLDFQDIIQAACRLAAELSAALGWRQGGLKP